ncbi:hypothetical protein DXG03_008277 [Asterophora parasitica]|uniref:Uncharacterized protein n=1 Tax=Asterophora parasitica TaxID=117018 RepID=A0A9P7G056_9AGAR|nr:hypothetical protein DXG03_008277 [Asterophora parasitica]
MNDTTTLTFPKSWACRLCMLQACFKVWTKDLATGGPETLANNMTDLYNMWVVWNKQPDELHKMDNAIWEEEVDAVRRVSEWLDQTGWLVTFAPCWHCIDGHVWLHIEAKNRFARSGELSLLAISISKLVLAASATPVPSSRPPTSMLEVTPTAMEAGSSEESHNKGSGVVALAAGVQDEDVEMTGLGADAENGGVVPGVEGRAIALDTDSGTTDMDRGPARNMGMMAESAAMELVDLLLMPQPRPHLQLPLMGTLWMLPSSWQELARVDVRAKAAGNAVASSSGSGHWPQTLVGVMIDRKHAATHEMGKTGVGLATDKCCQLNAFGLGRKSMGKVEAEVVSPVTQAKGRTCWPTVATCKALSNMVVEDSESDGGVEVVLGPSKAVNMVYLAAFSFLAPNREKKCMKSDTLLAWATAVAQMQKDSMDVPLVPMAIKREVRHVLPAAPFSLGMSSSCNCIPLPTDQAARAGAILSKLPDTVAHQPANI